MNGVLGSEHRLISTQLMKRFSDHFFLQPSLWPHNLSQEFSSLICQIDIEYSFGSMAQSSVEEELTKSVQLLPPILERGFTQEEIRSLNRLVGNHKSVLILHQQSKAIRTSS